MNSVQIVRLVRFLWRCGTARRPAPTVSIWFLQLLQRQLQFWPSVRAKAVPRASHTLNPRQRNAKTPSSGHRGSLTWPSAPKQRSEGRPKAFGSVMNDSVCMATTCAADRGPPTKRACTLTGLHRRHLVASGATLVPTDARRGKDKVFVGRPVDRVWLFALSTTTATFHFRQGQAKPGCSHVQDMLLTATPCR